MNDNLTKILPKQNLIREYCKKSGITFLGVFGSFARNEIRDTSDIDILVRFERVGDILEFIKIEYQLSDLLGRKVDLVEEKGIPELFKKRIKKEVVPIYERHGTG